MKASFTRLALTGSLALLAAVSVGCKKEEGGGAAAPNTAQAPAAQQAEAPAGSAAGGGEITDALREEAKTIFSTRCTPCHGPEGKGDGPASAGLTPPPRNFGDAEWQASVTDEHIEKIIQFGGAAVGKSPAMPPNPDLTDKPVVKALREHIRNLKQ